MPAGKADHQEAALPGHAADRRFRVVAADAVVDQIDAVRADRLLERVGQRLLAVAVEGPERIDDAALGAPRDGEVDLLLRRRRARSLARPSPCRAPPPRGRRRRPRPAPAGSGPAFMKPRSFSA